MRNAAILVAAGAALVACALERVEKDPSGEGGQGGFSGGGMAQGATSGKGTGTSGGRGGSAGEAGDDGEGATGGGAGRDDSGTGGTAQPGGSGGMSAGASGAAAGGSDSGTAGASGTATASGGMGGSDGAGGSSGGNAGGAGGSGGAAASGGASGNGGSGGTAGDNPNSGSNTMGWIGCSLGQNIATGYRRVGGTRMWTTYDTGGGTIHEWANSDSAYWAAFDQQVQDYGPPVAVWIQLCVNPTGATLEEARTVVDITRARAPGAYLYITGQPLYDAGHVCALAGDGGPERTDNLAKELAADDPNVHYAGTFGPLSASDVPIDACHPGVEGEDRLGTQAKGKWGQP